jgi:hypothetical protein
MHQQKLLVRQSFEIILNTQASVIVKACIFMTEIILNTVCYCQGLYIYDRDYTEHSVIVKACIFMTEIILNTVLLSRPVYLWQEPVFIDMNYRYWQYTAKLNQTLNKPESCINRTLNKVLKYEMFVNLTCINQPPVYSEHKSLDRFHYLAFWGAIMVVILWWLDLQLSIQSVPITSWLWSYGG